MTSILVLFLMLEIMTLYNINNDLMLSFYNINLMTPGVIIMSCVVSRRCFTQGWNDANFYSVTFNDIGFNDA